MSDLRSWAKRVNDASMRRMGSLREPVPSRGWPMAGMFAIGLIAGAVAFYALTQRSDIKRLARHAFTLRDEVSHDLYEGETNPVSVTSHRSNHRRKAAVEVT